MTHPIVQIIATDFLRIYRLEKSKDISLSTNQSVDKNITLDPVTLFQKLGEFGQQKNLIFLKNELSEQNFNDIIIKSWYPLMVFIKKGASEIPVLLYAENGKLTARIYESNEAKLVTISSLSDLPGTILKTKAIDGKEYIEVITCFANDDEEWIDDEDSAKVTPQFKMLSKFFKILASEKKEILLVLLYAAFSGVISLSLPLGVQSLVGFISSGQIVSSVVVLIGFILIGIILSGVMTIMQLELVEFMQQRLFAKTAFTFAFRIPRIRLESLLQYNPAELMNRFFDTITLQKGLSILLIDFSGAILQTIFGIILLSLYHPLFIILGAILITIMVLILRYTGPKGLKTSLKESAFKYFVANWLEETARSLSTFKLAGNTNFAMEKTDHFVGNYIKAREDHFKILKLQYYSFVGFKTLITALLLIFGAILIVNRQINLGQFIAAEIVIIIIMNAIEKIILKLDTVYDVLVSVEKITDVTMLPVETYKGVSVPVKPNSGLSVTLKNVSYKYSDRNNIALNNINISINSSERICLSGRNGSGKSTLIKVILGLYDNFEGSIQYNGLNLRDINKANLRNHIGDYFSQVGIFDGTLLENITIGRDNVTMEDVLWATNAAGIDEYINSLPEGLNTRMIGGNVRIPESMSRRIIIARNIVQKPALLILDDFLLGVERNSKKKILDLILGKEYNWTVLLISNDPMTMKAADRVIFLKEGQIEAEGDYESLSKGNFEVQQLLSSYTSSL